jgi:hypothetical protein
VPVRDTVFKRRLKPYSSLCESVQRATVDSCIMQCRGMHACMLHYQHFAALARAWRAERSAARLAHLVMLSHSQTIVGNCVVSVKVFLSLIRFIAHISNIYISKINLL